MIFRILLTLSVMGAQLPLLAYGRTQTLPVEVYGAMKNGKKLNKLWVSPGFDGSLGVNIGGVSDEIGDHSGWVKECLSAALQRAGKAGSSFTLSVAIVEAESRINSHGDADANVGIEGRILGPTGELVAAFYTRESSNSKGTERDNTKECANLIVLGIVKELGFATAKPYGPQPPTKRPAVMYSGASTSGSPAAAPSRDAEKAKPVLPAGKAPAMIYSGTPTMEISQSATGGGLQTTADAKAPGAAQTVDIPAPLLASSGVAKKEIKVTRLPSPAGPAEAKPTSLAPSPEPMKNGKNLVKIWISPSYEKSMGFSVGEISYQVDQRDDAVSNYLPQALLEIAKPQSAFKLHLAVVELTLRLRGSGGSSSGILAVEGRITAKDGSVVAAFRDRVVVNGTGDSTADARQCVRNIAVDIAKDLK